MIDIEGLEHEPLQRWWKGPVDIQRTCRDAMVYAKVRMRYYPDMHIKVIFLKDKEEVYKKSNGLYRSSGYCVLSENTIYLSAKDASVSVLRHEMGHLIFNRLLKGFRVSSGLHEVVAQFCEEGG